MYVETKVTLGEHEVDVYPQRHAYLTNKIGKFVQTILASETDFTGAEDILGFLGDNVYDLIVIAIPTYGKRCPKYEFLGYGSQEAMEAGEYDEDQDKSPNVPEIMNAFEVAAHINRFDAVKVIGNIVDPKMLKGWINVQVANAISGASAISPAPDVGPEASTTSGTTPQTSTENGDSPSNESPNSPPPISAVV